MTVPAHLIYSRFGCCPQTPYAKDVLKTLAEAPAGRLESYDAAFDAGLDVYWSNCYRVALLTYKSCLKLKTDEGRLMRISMSILTALTSEARCLFDSAYTTLLEELEQLPTDFAAHVHDRDWLIRHCRCSACNRQFDQDHDWRTELHRWTGDVDERDINVD